MRRIGKRAAGVVVIAVLVAAAVTTTAGSALATQRAKAAKAKPCNGHVELCARRLDQVTLAGAHNAYATPADGFTDAADSDCTPLCPDADNDLYAVCSATCRLPGGRQCGDCDDGRQGVHPGALESCNNRDDDCDSQTDEGDPGGGFQCSTGEDGACDAGTRHCRSGQLVCERNGDPQPEACANGEDDDCDGTQDAADPDCFQIGRAHV